jgi:hypothetical protein
MALTINDFSGRSGWACDPANPAAPPPPACRTGDSIVEGLGFEPTRLWLGFVGLVSLIFFYNGIGFVLLRRSKPRYLPLSAAAAKKNA